MNTLLTIIHGLAVGILVSAPMGPIGMLCIQRRDREFRKSGGESRSRYRSRFSRHCGILARSVVVLEILGGGHVEESMHDVGPELMWGGGPGASSSSQQTKVIQHPQCFNRPQYIALSTHP